jgi:hypothetical protein
MYRMRTRRAITGGCSELPAWDVERVLLRFDGVESVYRVWLNGSEVGVGKGSRLVQEFDVTELVKPGRNVIMVRVHQWSSMSYLEDQDQWWLPGIFRDVTLLGRPIGAIDDVWLRATYGVDGTGSIEPMVVADPATFPVRVSIPELGIDRGFASAAELRRFTVGPVLDLLDELGFWVILECDLETHGFAYLAWQGNPSDDPRWQEAYLDRIQRTLERDKNHPCVIIWSLGNEAGTGANLEAMSEWVRGRDPGRPVHYEGDHLATYTDVYSRMYPNFVETEAIGSETGAITADRLRARRRDLASSQPLSHAGHRPPPIHGGPRGRRRPGDGDRTRDTRYCCRNDGQPLTASRGSCSFGDW